MAAALSLYKTCIQMSAMRVVLSFHELYLSFSGIFIINHWNIMILLCIGMEQGYSGERGSLH